MESAQQKKIVEETDGDALQEELANLLGYVVIIHVMVEKLQILVLKIAKLATAIANLQIVFMVTSEKTASGNAAHHAAQQLTKQAQQNLDVWVMQHNVMYYTLKIHSPRHMNAPSAV